MPNDNDRLNLLFDLHRYTDAEKVAREAIAKNPNWGAGYTHLARALINQNKKDEAIAAAREGARKSPQDAWALGTLACALNWFGKTREALEPAEEAVRLDPRYPWAYAMLANILFNLNRFKDAHQKAIEGLKYDPLSESLFRWKAWADHKLGRQTEALATVEEAMKHYPNSHLLINLIGCIRWTMAEKTWVLKRIRLHREADTAIREAVRLDPSQPAYRDNLRGNALSCRRCVIGKLLPVLCVMLVVLPSCLFTLAHGVIRPAHSNGLIFVVFSAIIASIMVCSVTPESRSIHVAPLNRWNIPSVPQTDSERFWGWVWWYGVAAILLIPYVVAAVIVLMP